MDTVNFSETTFSNLSSVDSDYCSICCEKLTSNNKRVVETRCQPESHFFHLECISGKWIDKNISERSCANCKENHPKTLIRVGDRPNAPPVSSVCQGDYEDMNQQLEKLESDIANELLCCRRAQDSEGLLDADKIGVGEQVLAYCAFLLDLPLVQNSLGGKRELVATCIEAKHRVNLHCPTWAYEMSVCCSTRCRVSDLIESRNPLSLALICGKWDVADDLREAGAIMRKSQLLSAIDGSRAEQVKYMVKAGAEVNVCDDNGRTILEIAARNGNASIVESLLQGGADPNAMSCGTTPLYVAAEKGFESVAKALIKAGACVHRRGLGDNTPLQGAASGSDSASMVDILIQAGGKVNLTNVGSMGQPLLAAVYKGHLIVAKTLIQAGAYVNIRFNSGTHLLSFVLNKDYFELANIMLKAMTPEAARYELKDALLMAAKSGQINVVSNMIKLEGSGVEDEDVVTALNSAAENGDVTMVKALIKWKAVARSKAVVANALSIAKKKRNYTVESILTKLSAVEKEQDIHKNSHINFMGYT